ncbi:MAG: T9SS type A sorting domain-containing protein [Bacteroidales bacterium]|nr:T9SS type A sorting domain-containing protein [Bacteroidales bacterium]
MKKILLAGLILLITISAYSQKIALKNAKSNSQKVENIDRNTFTVSTSLDILKFTESNTKGGDFVNFTNPTTTKIYNVGFPALPVISKLIEVPQNAKVKVKVISYDEEIIKLSDAEITKKIMPSQPSLSKSADPADVPFYINETVYNTNEFYSAKEIISYEDAGQMRATRLGRLEINPFEYNPVTNELRVFNNIKIEVTFENADWTKTNELKNKYSSPYFDGVTNSFTLNKIELSKDLITDVPVTYVIVAPDSYSSTLQEFITWKRLKGFHVIEAYTSETGTTTTSIHNYLQNLYENPATGVNAPSFVLFVGDVAQIPPYSGTAGSHVTDLYFCEYTGDKIPEVFYGRWSAETTTELQSIIDKTLMYEKYEMPDPSYLSETFLIAGDDEGNEDTWGGGAIWYADNYYCNSEHGLYSHTFLQSTIETWGGNSTGNNIAHDSIIANINDGVALANYTAHCSSDGWYSPSFSRNDLSSLTNTNKYGIWIGNCCLSNEFDVSDCFGEIALYSANKGAIGYIGGSNSTYWDEDYYWGVGIASESSQPSYEGSTEGVYDGLFHDKSNEVNDISTWFIAQGQAYVCGNLAVQGSSSSLKTYYWEIYHLMGDPSIMNYIGVPDPVSVTYNPAVFMIGSASVDLTTEPYAYIAFTQDDNLIGVTQADASGNASLSFSSALTASEITVVISSQFHQQYIETFQPIAASEPYVLVDSYTPEEVFYNSTANIDVNFKNVANAGYDAAGVVATISTSDTYVTITDNSANIGDITGGQIIFVEDAFTFDVSNGIPDQHQVTFLVSISGNDAKYSWSSNITVTVNAPDLVGEFSNVNEPDGFLSFNSEPVTAADGGDNYFYTVEVIGGDGNLDPDETVNLNFNTQNIGHAGIYDAYGYLTSTSPYVTINNGESYIANLPAGATFTSVFNITTDPSTPVGTVIDFKFIFGDGIYQDTIIIGEPVGLVMEDFESGTLSDFWTTSGDVDWTVDNNNPYEGTYCAVSGDISDYGTTSLSLNLDGVSEGQTISFWYKVSSELSYDDFVFKVNGTEIFSENGEIGWTYYEYTFTSNGDFIISLNYEKDVSISSGDDCVWIDNVILPLAPAKGKGPKLISISATTIPSWLNFTDNGNGTALLQGVAPENTQTDAVVLEATNPTNTVTQSFNIVTAYLTAIYTIDNLIHFYPNPTADFLNINLENHPEKANVQIFDVNGKLVLSQYIMETENQIDLTGFAKGVYLINLTVDGQLLQNKLIIE